VLLGKGDAPKLDKKEVALLLKKGAFAAIQRCGRAQLLQYVYG
jgi:hypothetical protein